VLDKASSAVSRTSIRSTDRWLRVDYADTGIPVFVPRDHGMSLRELCGMIFASISRSDQRDNGMRYLQGLLAVEGRKSARNLARWLGPEVSEQSLHHFINSSSWDWTPVRQAIARYLLRQAPPRAWVVHSVLIPKTGQQSVGVTRRFVRSAGALLNAQQAVGIWAASERVNCPITWRLLLSGAWLDDTHRAQAGIPEGSHPEMVSDAMTEMATELTREWCLPPLPVLVDARGTGGVSIIRQLQGLRLPVLARIDEDLVVRPAQHAVRALTPPSMSARALMGVVKNSRCVVPWPQDNAGVVMRTSLVAAVRVRPLWRGGNNSADLLLLGAGERGRPWPEQLWLTDLTQAQPGPLFRMTRLLSRVEGDVQRTGDAVGLRDFTGRSFGGWHRHATLASAAYAVTALGEAAKTRRPYRHS
jgi:DDE superfamily endonuclease